MTPKRVLILSMSTSPPLTSTLATTDGPHRVSTEQQGSGRCKRLSVGARIPLSLRSNNGRMVASQRPYDIDRGLNRHALRQQQTRLYRGEQRQTIRFYRVQRQDHTLRLVACRLCQRHLIAKMGKEAANCPANVQRDAERSRLHASQGILEFKWHTTFGMKCIRPSDLQCHTPGFRWWAAH